MRAHLRMSEKSSTFARDLVCILWNLKQNGNKEIMSGKRSWS